MGMAQGHEGEASCRTQRAGTVEAMASDLLAEAGATRVTCPEAVGGTCWELPGHPGCAGLWLLPVSDGVAVYELRGASGEPEACRPVFVEHAAGELLDVHVQDAGRRTGVLLTRRGLQCAAIRLRRDPTALMRALRELGAHEAEPELEHALRSMARDWPGADVAQAFYGARVLEVLALAADADARSRAERLAGMCPSDRSALERARACIDENLGRGVATDELCRAANMSAPRLARLFRHAEGETPQEYARRTRMARARDLLEQSTLPLADVSRRLGFSRQGSFSEAFKARYGLTPHEYRALSQSPTLD